MEEDKFLLILKLRLLAKCIKYQTRKQRALFKNDFEIKTQQS